MTVIMPKIVEALMRTARPEQLRCSKVLVQHGGQTAQALWLLGDRVMQAGVQLSPPKNSAQKLFRLQMLLVGKTLRASVGGGLKLVAGFSRNNRVGRMLRRGDALSMTGIARLMSKVTNRASERAAQANQLLRSGVNVVQNTMS